MLGHDIEACPNLRHSHKSTEDDFTTDFVFSIGLLFLLFAATDIRSTEERASNEINKCKQKTTELGKFIYLKNYCKLLGCRDSLKELSKECFISVSLDNWHFQSCC